MEIRIGAIEGEEVDRKTRIDIITDEEEKIRAEKEEASIGVQKKEVNMLILFAVAIIK